MARKNGGRAKTFVTKGSELQQNPNNAIENNKQKTNVEVWNAIFTWEDINIYFSDLILSPPGHCGGVGDAADAPHPYLIVLLHAHPLSVCMRSGMRRDFGG
jgi:hypothetical protein